MASYTANLTIGQKIGNGHFGQVYDAVDQAHGQVAVKILRRKDDVDSDDWVAYKDSHLGEAQNLSRAEHPNVVKVHYVVEGDDGDSVAICMAFCHGGSLQANFERGPMRLVDLKKVATQLLHGLGALHARGMLHRDIKPANILLDRQGVAKLGDFGLVTDRLVLGYGSQAGYSDHIAYEVWHGAGTSAKSDIWALGMTLYRLLHGEQWYSEGLAPFIAVKEGGFANSLRWLPHVPGDWRPLIRKMLVDDPERRYQSAGQVLNGVATLSAEPEWETQVTPEEINWCRSQGSRRICVKWERISKRKHQWAAWSEPRGKGRYRTLGGSNGIVGAIEAQAQMREFFAN